MFFNIQSFAGETTLRTYIKPKLFATYAREKVNLLSFFQRQYFYCTFQYTYTECCFGDCLEYIDRYVFPAYVYIYVVLGLGSTDGVLLTSICLRKPHLEHKQKHGCLPQMQETCHSPFDFPKTCTSISGSSKHIQRVVFRGLCVRC